MSHDSAPLEEGEARAAVALRHRSAGDGEAGEGRPRGDAVRDCESCGRSSAAES